MTNEQNKVKCELVRNPVIVNFLLDENGNFKDENFILNPSDVIAQNHDALYTMDASAADPCYKYSDIKREYTNMRYLKCNSNAVPSNYKKYEIDKGASKDEEFIVPYDYLLVTRSDGSQFLISETFDIKNIYHDLKRYSIIRYEDKHTPYYEDIVYSDGIDLARMLDEDEEYLDVLANDFLSEKRINESLKSAYKSMDLQHSDETDHGGNYVGYIDCKTLSICSSLDKYQMTRLYKNPFVTEEA